MPTNNNIRPRKVILNYIEANGTATEALLATELSNVPHRPQRDLAPLLARMTAKATIIKNGDNYTLPDVPEE